MGILSGAMAGLGGGLADIGSMHIKKEAELDYQREIMALREQADVRADERRQRIKREDDQYAFDKKVERAPQELELDAAKETRLGKIKSDQRLEEKSQDRVNEHGFYLDNRDTIVGKERDMVRARDIDGEGRTLRNDATREDIETKKQIRQEREERSKIVEEYNAAVDKGDKAATDRASKKLEAHNRKYGRNDTNEWFVTKDENGVPFEYNRRTGEKFRIDSSGMSTRKEAESGGKPEVRYKGKEAYIKGPDGKTAVRAPQYDDLKR